MDYIFPAICCLILFLLNTVFDKIASGKLSGYLVTTIKASICCILYLVYAAFTGHIDMLFKFSSKEEFLIVIFFGITQCFNWFCYFLAMKKSNIDAFSCFTETMFLFCANIWTIIFSFSSSVNPNSSISIIVYIVGLCSIVGGSTLIATNKKMNEGTTRIWVLIESIACIIGSIYTIAGSLWIKDIPVELLTFYTMLIVVFVGIIICIFNKDYKEIKNIDSKSLLFMFLGAIVNVTVFITRLTVNGLPGTNIAVVNVIIASQFVILTLCQAIIKKKKFPKVVWVVFVLMIVGMILNSIAKSI